MIWRELVDAAHAAARAPLDLWPGLGAAARRAKSEPFPGQGGSSATVFAECLLKASRAFADAAPARRLVLADGLKGLADSVWRLMEEAREAASPNRIDLDG